MKNHRIVIKNKEALIKIFKTISWLDKQRWDKENNYNFINFFRTDLTNAEMILTHWICYITDRQMPFEIIWDKGGKVFSELVYDYTRKEIFLNDYFEEYELKGISHYRFKSTNEVFASRYVLKDKNNINQTLEILKDEKYNRNIIVFIAEILKIYFNQEDLLLRVACGLYLLTYQSKMNYNEIKTLISDNDKFEAKLKEFKNSSTYNKKRLWCCIRDYKKGYYKTVFTEAIKDNYPKNEANNLINKWKELPMDQIELPGDVWNNNPIFRDNLFKNIIELDNIPKTWNMPKIVKDLYNDLKTDNNISDFYPEQFDVTFDFVPRMCSNKMCDICPFGSNGVKYTCIPTKNKYCSVSLSTCGYKNVCDKNNCIMKSNISKGVCEGVLTHS